MKILILKQPRKEYLFFRFIAIHKGKFIADSALYQYPKDQPVLAELYVQPKYRKHGIGVKLQLEREKYAKQKLKAKKVSLFVERKSWMRDWYKRRGYSNEKPKGTDEVWLTKKL